jgi:hypothetical protein
MTPRRLSLIDTDALLPLACAHLTSLGSPGGNSFSLWAGTPEQWAQFDQAVAEYNRSHPVRW